MNEENKNPKQIRRKFSPEFKDQVLARAEKDGVAQTAKDLGIQESMIYYWRSKKRLSGTPLENQKMQQAETARLKREVERLSQENAFLKKVATYFTKESK
jgi:transposase